MATTRPARYEGSVPTDAQPPRVRTLAALLLAVAVLSGCSGQEPTGEADTPSASAPPPATTPATSGAAGTGTPSSPSTVQPTLFVFGDSYVAGEGATSPSTSFAYALGADLGWQTAVSGIGGTGYLNPGPSGTDQTYGTRFAQLPDTGIAGNVIVVEGGLNDRGKDPAELTAAATAFYQSLRARFPEARVFAVGATAPAPGDPAPSVAVNAAIAAGARATGVTFIDPVAEGWFTTENAAQYVDADGVHPTQAGHDHIAALLATDLLGYLDD